MPVTPADFWCWRILWYLAKFGRALRLAIAIPDRPPATPGALAAAVVAKPFSGLRAFQNHQSNPTLCTNAGAPRRADSRVP